MSMAFRAACATSTLLLATACSSSSERAEAPPAPVITASPVSPTLFEGQSATLGVAAQGSGTLTYQWSRNGVPVAGATASTYTIPAVSLGDDGARYTVAVANDGTPSVSAAAVLAVNPALDLRFKLVGATLAVGEDGVTSNILPTIGMSYDAALGSPLLVGSGIAASGYPNAAWCYSVVPLAKGMSGIGIQYQPGALEHFSSDLGAFAATDRIITSLDLEESAECYALSTLWTTQAGHFTPFGSDSMLPGDLPARAAQEGAAGRVITAVSRKGGQVWMVSYGWSMAPSARYETQVAFADASTAAEAASNLAAQGYVITAFGAGHNAAEGFVLVGTRLPGASLPRRLKVVTVSSPVAGGLLGRAGSDTAGMANVGQWYDAAANTTTMLYEQ